ncbi:hypothetical protein [Cesiribacter sp. SM1]|nr:hypothetical protein [Cesiribacter sp. SM1]
MKRISLVLLSLLISAAGYSQQAGSNVETAGVDTPVYTSKSKST